VHLIETLAADIRAAGWNTLVTHRELARAGVVPNATQGGAVTGGVVIGGLDSTTKLRQEYGTDADPTKESTGAVGSPNQVGEA